jgi:hypothetical protein
MELMLKMRRKSLVVCAACHDHIHTGQTSQHTRHSHWRAVCGEISHARFRGGPPGKGPNRVPRRVAYLADDRHEDPGRLRPQRPAGVDLRPGRRLPPRHRSPGSVRRDRHTRPQQLDRRQRICRQRHDHPIRRPAHRGLLNWENEFNTGVNKIRYQIERTIANLKTRRVLHTDYRRPLWTFDATISTVIALHFYATA